MKPGKYVSINYKAPDGTRRTASLTPTDVNHPGLLGAERVDDPQWMVTNPDGSQPVEEWMRFLASDGSTRKCRIASHYMFTGAIKSEFVWAYDDGSDENRKEDILFMDPDDGLPYRVHITVVVRPFPVSPQFTVG